MLNSVTTSRRIPWEIYENKSVWLTEFRIPVFQIEATQQCLDVLITAFTYRMFRYQDDNNQWQLGYGYSDTNLKFGVTEQEAYSDWIKAIKKKESQLANQLPLISMTQSQFDALFSLYVLTGDWKRVHGDEGTYDLYSAIKGERWLLAADMIANGKNRLNRLTEARILKLADYSTGTDRISVRREGVQFARTQYIRGIADILGKSQAEYAYFKQTNGTFLPGIVNLRQRQIVNDLR